MSVSAKSTVVVSNCENGGGGRSANGGGGGGGAGTAVTVAGTNGKGGGGVGGGSDVVVVVVGGGDGKKLNSTVCNGSANKVRSIVELERWRCGTELKAGSRRGGARARAYQSLAPSDWR